MHVSIASCERAYKAYIGFAEDSQAFPLFLAENEDREYSRFHCDVGGHNRPPTSFQHSFDGSFLIGRPPGDQPFLTVKVKPCFPSGAASAVTVSPSCTSPDRSMRASWSPISRWMSRRSGRAP